MTTDDLTNNTKTNPLVLSYNICYQAMENSRHGSAAVLGGKCDFVPGQKYTKCAVNIANAIDSFPASVGRTEYDFVGLQEANRAEYFFGVAKNTIGKMGSFYSQNTTTKDGKSITIYMASYYDQTKYDKVHEYGGFFPHYEDRLFQILVFKNKFDASGTIFINIHSPHGFTFSAIEATLSTEVAKFNLTEAEKNYRIIAVGDFNETGWDWNTNKMDPNQMEWTPFTEIPNKLKINNFVFTCSKDDGNWADSSGKLDLSGTRGGDYIFDSKQAATILTPTNYDPKVLQSDHLPVIAELF